MLLFQRIRTELVDYVGNKDDRGLQSESSLWHCKVCDSDHHLVRTAASWDSMLAIVRLESRQSTDDHTKMVQDLIACSR
jgi:hypothetical protein